MTDFWFSSPSVLLDKKYVLEIWPSAQMNYEQKLNALTRAILLLTLFGFLFTGSVSILCSGIVTVFAIVFIHKYRYFSPKKIEKESFANKKEKEKFNNQEEEQEHSIELKTRENLEKHLQSNYHDGKKRNPFNNVLLTEIQETPDRYAAPPSFHPIVEENITKNVKKSVQLMNPGIDNTNKQLFSSLWDNFLLDQSNRVFYSTANTRIEPGDQTAFGQYLYGNMPSSKESNVEAALARVQDSYRYTLY
jgi:Ca2+/Na+ antiporter